MEILIEDRVLIKPDPLKDKTESGLILDIESQPPPPTGTVLAVGTGKKGEKMVVKPGDRVLFSTQMLFPFSDPEAGVLFITHQSYVHAVIERPDGNSRKK